MPVSKPLPVHVHVCILRFACKLSIIVPLPTCVGCLVLILYVHGHVHVCTCTVYVHVDVYMHVGSLKALVHCIYKPPLTRVSWWLREIHRWLQAWLSCSRSSGTTSAYSVCMYMYIYMYNVHPWVSIAITCVYFMRSRQAEEARAKLKELQELISVLQETVRHYIVQCIHV